MTRIDKNKIGFINFDEMLAIEPLEWWIEEISVAFNYEPTDFPARVEVCNGQYQFDIDLWEYKQRKGYVLAGCSAYYDYPWRLWGYFKSHAKQNEGRDEYNQRMKPYVEKLEVLAKKENWN